VKKTGELYFETDIRQLQRKRHHQCVRLPTRKTRLGEDQSLCQGESATLDAGTADSYEWSNGETTKTIEVSEDASTALP
jgi:hypothetical protein